MTERNGYQKERLRMVETQLRARGLRDDRVLEAMARVPRHLFIPTMEKPYAYEDRALPIGEGQTISQPFMVAIMTELLDPGPADKVLEIGTGSGYQAAVLSLLCREVHTVERVPALYERTTAILKQEGYVNVVTYLSDGTLGLPEEAPFDVILITAAAPDIPAPILDQLDDGGRLVAPVGSRYGQTLIRIHRKGDVYERSYSTPCVFVPLIGLHGFSPDSA